LYTGAIAFLIALASTPLLTGLLRRFGAIDGVGNGKIHARPTPRGGGIAIFFAFTIAVLLPNYRDNPMKGVLIGAFICLVVGAIDDFRGGISARWKLGALTAGTLLMSAFGVRLNLFQSYPLDLALTWLWIVGITSAFNGIDNMDGLASGVAAVVATMFLVIATQSYHAAGTETELAWFGLLAAGLIGANLGFLVFNFKPARVFMGDAGSFFLGFTLAALGVMGQWSEQKAVSITIPMLILGVPIFDFGYILISRIVRGETRTLRDVIEHCAPDHLSHRLVNMGFSQRQSVLLIYIMATTLGISGVLLHNSRTIIDSALGLLQGVAVLSLIAVLMSMAHRQTARAAANIRRLEVLAQTPLDDETQEQPATAVARSA
jgi:UDP-GlcNAc:undecaprenyl-phosphate GlcNAc-1-phosphate transferase